MNHSGFLNGVGAAAILAVLGSISATVVTPLIGASALYMLLIPALGLAYIGYCLSNKREKVGRATVLGLWLALAIAAWFLKPTPGLYLLLHVSAIWLIRSLYFYSSLISTVLDLALNAIAVAAALWAFVHTGSLFASIWCFFLTQALSCAIPATVGAGTGPSRKNGYQSENFQRARKTAEAALQQLFAK